MPPHPLCEILPLVVSHDTTLREKKRKKSFKKFKFPKRPKRKMPRHPLRKNGCSPPIKRDQILGALNVISITIAYYVMCVCVAKEEDDASAIAIAIHGVAFVVTLVLWILAETIDPASQGTCGGLPCYKHTESRYDREMGKKIPGLDHHCKWLGTAIGSRNYGIFFSLICSLLVQYTIQLTFGIVFLILYDDDLPWWGIMLILFHEVWCVICLYFDGNLVVFHIQLMREGKTSYEWLLEQARKRTAKRRNERSHQKEQKEKPSKPENVDVEIPQASEK